MRPGRRGSGIIESLVALLLTAGLLILVAGLLVRYQRTGRTLSTALAADPGARVDEETGLWVRNFVGSGERCGEAAWRYQGRRGPDPERDSVWVVTEAGRVGIAALAGVRPGSCSDAARMPAVELETDPPLMPGDRFVRVFESGRYRIDDAVRYGRVGRGAQPLSAPVLDAGRSGIAGGTEVEVVVFPRGRTAGYTGRWGR